MTRRLEFIDMEEEGLEYVIVCYLCWWKVSVGEKLKA